MDNALSDRRCLLAGAFPDEMREGHGAGTCEGSADLLAWLHELLRAAGCTSLATGQRAHLDLAEQLTTLRAAAGQFALPDGRAFDDHLWTSAVALRDGTMARSLSQAPGSGRGSHAYLVLPVVDAGRQSLYWRQMRPLGLRESVGGDLSVGGPYLALVQCERDLMGDVTAMRASVQAIHSSSVFLPVSSDAERDLLQVLLRLQERLDLFGWRCTIRRELIDGSVAPVIGLEVGSFGTEGKVLRLSCRDEIAEPAKDGSFAVKRSMLADGTLAAWLREAIESAAIT
jgi:hypothetical protein